MHLALMYNLSLPVVAALLALPVALYTYGNSGLVLADVVSVIGVLAFLRRFHTFEAFCLACAVVLGFAAIVMSLSDNGMAPLRQIGSLIFFFKPCLAYFCALLVIRTEDDARNFFASFSLVAWLVLISLFATIIYSHGGLVRSDSEINGSVFGLPPFGAYGVNSLATYFAVCSFIAFLALSIEKKWKLKLLHLSGAFGFACLTVFSVSREAILGLIVMYTFLMLSMFTKRPASVLFLIVIGIGSLLASLPWLEKSQLFDVKLAQIRTGLELGDWDYLSSGRLRLYTAALHRIAENPFGGTAFLGFDAALQGIFEIESVEGLSPHNQYITAGWKMGIPGALFYLTAVAAMHMKAARNVDGYCKHWLFAFAAGFLLDFANLWDVLIVPNVGALFFFTLGALTAINRRVRVHSSTDARISG